jgi:AraC family transcriptional regulator, regulatory protein of adaptative response / DNA-3-methyladenine glycosylase II
VYTDFDRCYRAVQSKDARFDGWFVTAVLTTKIYCRPSCPVRPPFAKNLTFLPTAAAAQQAGFRACKRCRPDASPGSPEWNARGDTVGRAMRLIGDGVVEREGVAGLAASVGYSVRQLERLLTSEVGAGPLALARAQRAQIARTLIELTDLPFADAAYGAGFASVRQFNDTIRDVFDQTPTALRTKSRASRGDETVAAGVIDLRLPFRRPLEPGSLFGHLVATAVPGCEEFADGAYRRTMALPHGSAMVSLAPNDGFVRCRLELDDVSDLPIAVARCRRLLDLDADPDAVTAELSRDAKIRRLVRRAPGRRIPGSIDGREMAVRAVLGQQVSTAAARTHAARLVVAYGTPLRRPHGTLTHLFPTMEQLAEGDLTTVKMPKSRQRCLRGVVDALAADAIDLGVGCDWDRAREQLAALPGVGPWTVEIIALRGLGDPDAFPLTDMGARRGAEILGLPDNARHLAVHAARWRPWRAYATQYLWAATDHPINHWPPKGLS